MSFEIILATEEKTPIYKQLVSQFEDAIRSGKLQPGEQIPSMNEFAANFNISKETVKKAYGILRDKDLLIPRQGKGFYVAHSRTELLKEKRIQGLEKQMIELIKQCKNAKLSKQDMIDMLEVLYDEQ